ncbi:MAG: flavodoxin family protein [Thermoflexales bacterium]|nr:flavodoxin family protein [Thermoflexales bacterium]
MKILALLSSYRKKGNTARIVQMIEGHMKAIAARQHEALDFEILYLSDMDIRPCGGCRSCFDRGEDLCPLKDELPAIRAKMDAADGLILASPVYMDDVNGVAKNWIDRLAHVSHRPAFGGKCAYPLATVGGSSTSHALRTMNAALLVWGFHLVGQAGYKMGALMEQAVLEGRFQKETARVAEQLFRAVSERQALRPAFVSLVAFKIQQLAWQRESPGSYDYDYWQKQGWLAPPNRLPSRKWRACASGSCACSSRWKSSPAFTPDAC